MSPLDSTAEPAASDGRVLVGLILISLLTLWDYYIPEMGVRPFDIAAVSLVFVVVSVGMRKLVQLDSRHAALIVTFSAVVITFCVRGLVYDVDGARPGIGLLLGVLAFACGCGLKFPDAASVGRLLAAVTLAHCLVFWIQTVWYYTTGAILNFHWFLGAEPRLLGPGFRGAGLYLEPAHFSVSIFLLVFARWYLTGTIGLVGTIAAASVFASLSLWGILAFFLMAGVLLWRRWQFWIVASVLIAGSVLFLSSRTDPADFWLLERVASLSADSSASIRYGALLSTVIAEPWDPRIWFGTGVTNDYLAYGASGLGFMVAFGGLSFALLFVLSVAWGARPGARVATMIAIALILTATSLWTYMIWWLWLGLILGYRLATSRP